MGLLFVLSASDSCHDRAAPIHILSTYLTDFPFVACIGCDVPEEARREGQDITEVVEENRCSGEHVSYHAGRSREREGVEGTRIDC